MADGWPMVGLSEYSIDEGLYDRFRESCVKRNANPYNEISRLIRMGLEEIDKLEKLK